MTTTKNKILNRKLWKRLAVHWQKKNYRKKYFQLKNKIYSNCTVRSGSSNYIIMRDLSSVKVTPGRQIPRLKKRKEKNNFLCFSWLFIFLDFRDTHSSSIQITQHKSSSDCSIDYRCIPTLKTNLHGIECEASVM